MRHYQVPCHACGHAQALVWSNVRWDKTPDGKHLPATAHYVCESCGAIWTDTDRHDAVAKGQWVASKPDVIGVAGFHITGLLSPWVALADIVQEFLMSKNDPALLQVWTNTVLGEPFEPAQETVEGSSLLRRGENYGPQSIPDAVKLLTAGVDVQGDRHRSADTWLRRLRGNAGPCAMKCCRAIRRSAGLGPAGRRADGTLPHRRRPRIAGARHLCR